MTDEIRPALTPEEWTETLDPAPDTTPIFEDEGERQEWIRERMAGRVAWHGDYKRLHKAAAMALYGQPFGFTQEDVALLKALLEGLVMGDCGPYVDVGISPQHAVLLAPLAAKVAALLPPK